ncbi:MAG: glutamine-hydrolyzing carbamoyl-phosphate synthase small subunit [Proteobacteria bacterium]|nr:glutamine-hydrolyzing carbamoyl-phosphate synthase small subunit [Pseudomonadota bacterium]
MTAARLALADGTIFTGTAAGASGTATGEAVFTTGMTGYQEVVTDPSYCGQIVVMTAPQIGNTGVNLDDEEAAAPALSGFVVHELASEPSSWRARETLDCYLKRHRIVALRDVDTRSLTRHIRDRGAQMAALGTDPSDELVDLARAAPPMEGRDLTQAVTTNVVYEWDRGSLAWTREASTSLATTPGARWHVVAMDFGVKHNILRCLVDAGCRVTVVPAATGVEAIANLGPDAIFLSNGPGDPAAVSGGTDTVRELLGRWPVFGICLGHQIMCLALGASSYKLKFGHHGLNQPVKDLGTGRVEITSQNHGFCVDMESLRGRCEVTHRHLNDGTCEGIRHVESGAFGVQYHPEASAGPHDARYLFRRFVQQIEGDTRHWDAQQRSYET